MSSAFLAVACGCLYKVATILPRQPVQFCQSALEIKFGNAVQSRSLHFNGTGKKHTFPPRSLLGKYECSFSYDMQFDPSLLWTRLPHLAAVSFQLN